MLMLISFLFAVIMILMYGISFLLDGGIRRVIMLVERQSIFFEDSRLKHRVVFERGTFMKCIYCSGIADTREHTPSKVFLAKSLPATLGMLPACKQCNNGFSINEVKVYLTIQLTKKICDNHDFNDKTKRLIEKFPVVAKEIEESIIKYEKYRLKKNILKT